MSEISIKAEKIYEIGGFALTNAVLLAVLSALALLILAGFLRRNLKMVPGKLQSFSELFLDQLLGLMDAALGKRALSEKYLPLIATIFVFVLTSNWLGLVPGVGSIGVREHELFIPLFRAPASDLNFTIALAIISVLGVNLVGALALGIKTHLSKFFSLKNPILSFVGLLEFISEFVKIISFSFRLFGNVFAGEVLLVIVGFLVPFLAPLPFLALEIFVGFIQAFIFAMLTLVFVAMAVKEEAPH